MSPITVLFVNHENDPEVVGGSFLSLVDMISALKDDIRPIVLCKSDASEPYRRLRAMGVECIVYHFTSVFLRCSRLGFLAFFCKNVTDYYKRDLACIRQLKEQLAGRKIDIVHTNNTAATVGHYLAKALSACHVWHVREHRNPQERLMLGEWRLRRLMNKAAARIPISKSLVQTWRLREDNTFVIGDAVRSVSEVNDISEKEKYILWCSTYISKSKGADTAIEVFGRSQLASEGWQLYMLGMDNENMMPTLEGIARKYGVTDQVKFLGFVDDVKPYFQKASLYLMTSLREGLSRTSIEAMSYGCPVLSHRVGGVLDFIFDGDTGYLYSTIDECMEKMRHILSHDHTALIRRAQDYVSRHYSIAGYGAQIMKVYQNVLK